MKTLEAGGSRFVTWLGNATALPVEVIHPLIALHLGYTVEGKWRLGRITLGRRDDRSLYYNAVCYVRLMLPFWIGIQVRWGGSHPAWKEYLQIGLGWKGNGRLGVILRIQSDFASSRGVRGPNFGQAQGWEDGTK